MNLKEGRERGNFRDNNCVATSDNTINQYIIRKVNSYFSHICNVFY